MDLAHTATLEKCSRIWCPLVLVMELVQAESAEMALGLALVDQALAAQNPL